MMRPWRSEVVAPESFGDDFVKRRRRALDCRGQRIATSVRNRTMRISGFSPGSSGSR